MIQDRSSLAHLVLDDLSDEFADELLDLADVAQRVARLVADAALEREEREQARAERLGHRRRAAAPPAGAGAAAARERVVAVQGRGCSTEAAEAVGACRSAVGAGAVGRSRGGGEDHGRWSGSAAACRGLARSRLAARGLVRCIRIVIGAGASARSRVRRLSALFSRRGSGRLLLLLLLVERPLLIEQADMHALLAPFHSEQERSIQYEPRERDLEGELHEHVAGLVDEERSLETEAERGRLPAEVRLDLQRGRLRRVDGRDGGEQLALRLQRVLLVQGSGVVPEGRTGGEGRLPRRRACRREVLRRRAGERESPRGVRWREGGGGRDGECRAGGVERTGERGGARGMMMMMMLASDGGARSDAPVREHAGVPEPGGGY